MTDVTTAESGEESQRQKQPRTRLKYLKYSPPSSAGAEPGQWRQALGRTRTAGRASQGSDLDVISLSVDVANVSLDFKNGSSAGGTSDRSSNNKGNKYRGQRRGDGGKGGGGGRSGPGRSAVATPGTPADPLVFNGKWTRRSTSNRLLNCFTIDDCMARYRTRLALGHGGPEAWATAKAELAYSLDTFPNPRHNMESASDAGDDDSGNMTSRTARKNQGRYPDPGNSGPFSPGGGESLNDTYLGHLQGGSSDYMCNNDNEALTKAMRTIFNSTEVVNNSARTGLFRRTKPRRNHHPSNGNYPGQNHTPDGRPESTRFRKRNEALHKWIDDEVILPRSRLGSMNSINSSNGSAGGSRGQSPTPPRSGAYRGPRSMEQPDIVRRKPAPADPASSRLGDSDPGGLGDQEGHKGPHRSDSFLEMLMELDEDKRSAITQPTSGGDTDTQGSVKTSSTTQVNNDPGGD